MKPRKPETALQQDYCFQPVDDYNMENYLLPALHDPARRKAIVEGHRERPIYRGTRPGAPSAMDSPELRLAPHRKRGPGLFARRAASLGG